MIQSIQYIWLLFIVALLASACNFKSEQADVIFHNAVVFTCDGLHDNTPKHLAIAVKDGRIVAVGAEYAIRNTYRCDELVDLKQAVVYPGFIDAHAHFMGYALTLSKVNLVGTKSYDEVLSRLEAFAHSNPEGWLTGRGWDQNDWQTSTYPTLTELDQLFPIRPVAIRRIDGHALLANTAALKIAGLEIVRDFSGGEMLSLEDGSPSGILIDAAAEYLLKVIPDQDDADKRRAMIIAEKNLFAAGLTSVVDAGLDIADIRLIDSMHKSGELSIRIVAMASGTHPNLDSTFNMGPWRTDRLIAESIKFYMDGSLGSRGAALVESYSDRQDHTSFLFLDSADYCNALIRAKEDGFQVATHCIGDAANHGVLNYYHQVLGGVNDRRWRIEHAQVVNPEDLWMFGRASIIPSVQPTHATSDMYWAGERLGKSRIRHAYRYRDLMNTIGILPLGTDMPVENIDPLKTFYAATIRKDATGYPEEGYMMDQALDRSSALLGMTLWSAIANNNDSEVGSIEVGKWADLVVLDMNLLTAGPEDILSTRVLRTVVAGKTTFNASNGQH